MITIIKSNEKGEITLTEKQLQKILAEAHDAAYNEGYSKGLTEGLKFNLDKGVQYVPYPQPITYPQPTFKEYDIRWTCDADGTSTKCE